MDTNHGVIRKLWMRERSRLCDHLLRLDPDSRRLRFTHGVSDAFIKDYVAGINDLNAVVYGFFDHDGDIRAAAELRKANGVWGREAEAAFSVERTYQNHGLGSELLGRVIRAARNRGVSHLCVICLAENSKMQRIARKHSAVLRFEDGEIVGRISPMPATPLTMLQEAAEDQSAYARLILDLHGKWIPAAVA